jgi:hypothetical protein
VRFGHFSFQSLHRLANHDMVHRLPPLQQVEQLCDACLAGKLKDRNNEPERGE